MFLRNISSDLSVLARWNVFSTELMPYQSSPIATPSRPGPRGLLITSNRLSDTSRSNSPSDRSSTPPAEPKQPSARALRCRFIKLRRKYEGVLRSYYELGNSYSEPVSSLMYSLASELGREDNDLLWYAIVGIGSLELYGRDITGVGIGHKGDETRESAGWGGERGFRIRQLLRDEVRRLNPPKIGESERDMARGEAHGVIPTTARSPTDNSIRLSPEPKFLLIRHWSLYDSMLHSPYLAPRLQIWSDAGRKRLHKLLAKMGVSLTQSRQTYAHMDMDLKRCLRERLLKYAPVYGLDGLVPPVASTGMVKEGWGFVRSWGWKACLSANDVAVVIGAILEVGKSGVIYQENRGKGMDRTELEDEDGVVEGETFVSRFWEAYDGLGKYEYFA
jgi:cell division control protein 45